MNILSMVRWIICVWLNTGKIQSHDFSLQWVFLSKMNVKLFGKFFLPLYVILLCIALRILILEGIILQCCLQYIFVLVNKIPTSMKHFLWLSHLVFAFHLLRTKNAIFTFLHVFVSMFTFFSFLFKNNFGFSV